MDKHYACPVCTDDALFFIKVEETGRSFFKCPGCCYIFESLKKQKFDIKEEESHFKKQWEKSPEGGNPGCYPIIISLAETMKKNPVAALDFGCGDGGLIRFLRGKGIQALGTDQFPVENDMTPFVYPYLEDVPIKKFDIITCVEVLEHLNNPTDVLRRLSNFLSEDGFIFITTALTNRSMATIRFFPHWIYQKDPTHIGFFHERTFELLGNKLNLDVQILEGDGTIILDKTFRRIIVPYEGKYCFGQ